MGEQRRHARHITVITVWNEAAGAKYTASLHDRTRLMHRLLLMLILLRCSIRLNLSDKFLSGHRRQCHNVVYFFAGSVPTKPHAQSTLNVQHGASSVNRRKLQHCFAEPCTVGASRRCADQCRVVYVHAPAEHFQDQKLHTASGRGQ